MFISKLNVWFQKISIPHHGGNWKFQGVWGGGFRGPGNSRGEGVLEDKNHFQGLNFDLSMEISTYRSGRSLSF